METDVAIFVRSGEAVRQPSYHRAARRNPFMRATTSADVHPVLGLIQLALVSLRWW
jgi:hypothetical protein